MAESEAPVQDGSVKALLEGHAKLWEKVVDIMTEEVQSLRKQTALLAGEITKLKACSERRTGCRHTPGDDACIECWSLHAEERVKEDARRHVAEAEARKWGNEFASAGMSIKWDFDKHEAEAGR